MLLRDVIRRRLVQFNGMNSHRFLILITRSGSCVIEADADVNSSSEMDNNKYPSNIHAKKEPSCQSRVRIDGAYGASLILT